MNKQIIIDLQNSFEAKKRENGKEFVCQKNGTSEELKDAMRQAHGVDIMPDDFRFNTISSLCDSILEYEFNTIDELLENDNEICDNLVDAYNNDLLNWLSSNLTRPGYVNEAVNECYCESGQGGFDIMNTVRTGQYLEIQELFNNLVSLLAD